MRKLLIATTNEGKLEEIRHFFSDQQFELISLKDIEFVEAPEETGETIEQNAILKAKYYGEKTGLLTLADDGGLFIDELNGWPGIYSARIANSSDEQCSVVLEKMKNIPVEKRSAHFDVAMCLYDPTTKNLFVTSGIIYGSIATEITVIEKVLNLYGFNRLFYVKELNKTFAEMPILEKNSISHRGKALSKMKYILENNYRAKHIVVPVALIIKNGKLLMTKRNDPHRPDYHNKWEFPGGSMEVGESFEENIIREVSEESGYDVEMVERINHIAVETQTSASFTYQVYLVPFVCKIIGGDGKFSDSETLDAQWFDLDDVLNHEMIGENARMYREFLPELKIIIARYSL